MGAVASPILSRFHGRTFTIPRQAGVVGCRATTHIWGRLAGTAVVVHLSWTKGQKRRETHRLHFITRASHQKIDSNLPNGGGNTSTAPSIIICAGRNQPNRERLRHITSSLPLICTSLRSRGSYNSHTFCKRKSPVNRGGGES